MQIHFFRLQVLASVEVRLPANWRYPIGNYVPIHAKNGPRTWSQRDGVFGTTARGRTTKQHHSSIDPYTDWRQPKKSSCTEDNQIGRATVQQQQLDIEYHTKKGSWTGNGHRICVTLFFLFYFGCIFNLESSLYSKFNFSFRIFFFDLISKLFFSSLFKTVLNSFIQETKWLII